MHESFAVGDRVRVICNVGCFGDYHMGEIGTIRDITGLGIGIAFDNNICGHDLNGKCENGHGWWIDVDLIEKVCDELHELPAFQPADSAAILSLLRY